MKSQEQLQLLHKQLVPQREEGRNSDEGRTKKKATAEAEAGSRHGKGDGEAPAVMSEEGQVHPRFGEEGQR